MHDTDGAKIAPVTLIIYGTGTAKLYDSGSGMDSYKLVDEGLACKPNTFEVTKYNEQYGQPNEYKWSHDFKFIDLTLEDGCSKGNKKECSIKIGDSVGLKWKEGFKPRVIL